MIAYRRLTWLVMVLWLLYGLTQLDYNGPFFDEAIYITAGQRTLEGHGISDGYLTWFGGHLLWPTLAAAGYLGAGLLGTRLLALLLSLVALLSLSRATHNLFGPRPAFWATLAFSLNGPFTALAHLGVYDTLALAGIAVSFWALTEMVRQDNRAWLIVAALAYSVGLFAKYPMALMILPLSGLILARRKGRSFLDLAIFAFASGALVLALFLPSREQLAGLASWRLGNSPDFGVTLPTIAYAVLYYSATTFVLALGGWLLTRRDRFLATTLISSLTIWPAYHLLLADPVSTNKHLVFGFLFAHPLVGLALDALWRRRRLLPLRRIATVGLVAVLAFVGYWQLEQSHGAWPDVRPAAAYLVSQVEPGDELLINESWPYTMYLYSQGRIDSPWDVYDGYRLTHGELERDLCEITWFVDSGGSFEWPEGVVETVQGCGTFEAVFSSSSTMTGLTNDFHFNTAPVEVVVWRNRGGRS
jgi:4-amino-4-deoxy-L-arabinose transferase-like glycosyltransferase